MLIRQKTVLALLSRANKPLSPTVFVKLAFLLRQETGLKNEPTFYDFVPYKYGPFSFALYRELTNLRRDGYVTPDEERVAICEGTVGLAEEKIDELPAAFHEAVEKVVRRYGRKSQSGLVKDVYTRYPWYAIKSELTGLRPNLSMRVKKASPAVYTAGYEGKSVDAFFNHLLKNGIWLIIDVRANPVSRRYGFSKRQFSEIARRLGLDYLHMPELGIPSKYRVNLSDFDSYQRLMKKYEQEMIPKVGNEIDEVGKLMMKTPAVLVCVEKDVRCCHRSRLAVAVSRKTGLEVKHI
ncbi:MAG: hypothetical protein DRH50_04310 [Deltaproteobacteria bacterium]|nr:MAG: hypothetical protein DRH50_04310 [Deltaproteobacteria bacterium]